MSITVKAAIVGPHRLDMLNAATGERIGHINTRPNATATMTPIDIHHRVSMYCELASAFHAPETFIPEVTPNG